MEVARREYLDGDTTGSQRIIFTPICASPYYFYVRVTHDSDTFVGSEAKITVEQGNKIIAKIDVFAALGGDGYDWNVLAIKDGQLIIQNTFSKYFPDAEYAN